MIGYELPVDVLNVHLNGFSDDLKTTVWSGMIPVTNTEGSSGIGKGGSKVRSSFLGSAKKCFTLSTFFAIDSFDVLTSCAIFESMATNSAWRSSVLRVS